MRLSENYIPPILQTLLKDIAEGRVELINLEDREGICLQLERSDSMLLRGIANSIRRVGIIVFVGGEA